MTVLENLDLFGAEKNHAVTVVVKTLKKNETKHSLH